MALAVTLSRYGICRQTLMVDIFAGLSNSQTYCKGAPALESRTEGRLVSPTTAGEKKNCTPPDLALNLDFSMVEHARLCQSVVVLVEMIH
jgi:hypothetical protein